MILLKRDSVDILKHIRSDKKLIQVNNGSNQLPRKLMMTQMRELPVEQPDEYKLRHEQIEWKPCRFLMSAGMPSDRLLVAKSDPFRVGESLHENYLCLQAKRAPSHSTKQAFMLFSSVMRRSALDHRPLVFFPLTICRNSSPIVQLPSPYMSRNSNCRPP